ncbi:glycosyl transferase [Enterovibrio norvegicus FF-454]|uniref:Glycosyl transferase n=1 Tax=Enterovibrio norvegicus FF-454 TaxID=1185651 RepID=A0A1E5C3J9_9GAMM|nr:glycosyltransferase [Enterovibrio norvegicus]OEE60106.1 glycosyl transferase [Enterovibrio norvegicus FF-454]
MIELSIVIPTYNRRELLSHTLNALAEQTLSSDSFEVIIIDDGGSDNSEAIVQSFSEKLNVKYFWQEDKGFRAGKARNVGTAIAEGKYVVYLDTGVLLATGALEEHLFRHKVSTHPIAIVGYVYGFDLDEEGVKKMESVISPNNVDAILRELDKQGMHDIRQSQYDDLGQNISDWPAPFDLFWTCHVSAEREELIKAGMFDERFNSWGGEDVDLGVRLFRNNNMFIVDKSMASFHWPHPKEVKDTSDSSKSAAELIHSKYNIWQTSYYNLDHEINDLPLNKLIKVMKTSPNYPMADNSLYTAKRKASPDTTVEA